MNENKKFNLQYACMMIMILILIFCIRRSYGEKIKEVEYEPLLEISQNYDATKSYFDYQKENLKEDIKKDEAGIILKEVKLNDVYDIKEICHYGLMMYSKYIEENDEEAYKIAKQYADYLLAIQNQENGGFYHDYPIDVPSTEYKIREKWLSATSQSIAISLLSRIYTVENDEKYKIACEMALQPFKEEVSEGGLHTTLYGYDFYEEYPTKVASYSLSGLMYTMVGMYDEYMIMKNDEAHEVYNNLLQTLKFSLAYYNRENISLQNLAFLYDTDVKKEFSESVHREHIYLLEWINNREKEEQFEYFINLWKEMYQKNELK